MKKKETTLSVLKDIRAILKANNTFLAQTAMKPEQNIAKELGVSTNSDESKYFKITDDGTKKTSELLNDCRAKFKVWSWYDDAKLDEQFPAPEVSTTRYFKKLVEADEENANKSAEDLKDKAGITLRERIIMELQYFNETGGHLDITNWTLCSSSRDADGHVPRVHRDGGDCSFSVGWDSVGNRAPELRSRVAVPFP